VPVKLAVHDVTDLVVSMLDDLAVPGFPAQPVLRLLGPSLDAELANFQEVNRRTGEVRMIAPGCTPRNADVGQLLCREVWTATPLRLAGDQRELRPWSGERLFGSAHDWRRSSVRRLLGVIGVSDQAAGVPLTIEDTRVSGLAFARPHDEFTEDELDLLSALQPLLRAMERHGRLVARWHADHGLAAPLALAAARDTDLTARELVVLCLLARGCTSTAAAHRLGCSPRTVEKHTANLYRKLGVGDRVSALVEAQRRGLLPVPEPTAT
jgi:DNA-binding CsgD family transcriptional regulator